MTVISGTCEELAAGWLYLFDVAGPERLEYRVHTGADGVSRYQRVENGRKGPYRITIEVRSDGEYHIAYSSVRWTDAFREELARTRSARDSRMDMIQPGSGVAYDVPDRSFGLDEYEIIISTIRGELGETPCRMLEIDDSVGAALRLALNYQAARAAMVEALSALGRGPWFRTAMMVNPLRGLDTNKAIKKQLRGLDGEAIDRVLGTAHRTLLRKDLKNLKAKLVKILQDPLNYDPTRRLFIALADFCALPASRQEADDATYLSLWTICTALLTDIAEPAYALDQHLESDIQNLWESDRNGTDDPGLALLRRLADPGGLHPLHAMLFPSGAPVKRGNSGQNDANFDKAKFVRSLANIGPIERAVEFLQGYLACFIRVCNEPDGPPKSLLDLLDEAKFPFSRREQRLGTGLHADVPDKDSSIDIDIMVVELAQETTSWLSWKKTAAAFRSIAVLFHLWNLGAAIHALESFRGATDTEKSAAIAQLSQAFLESLKNVAPGIPRAFRLTGAHRLQALDLARRLSGRAFASFLGGLGLIVSAFDIFSSLEKDNRSAAVGASIMALGSLISVAAMGASVPIVGWIASAVTLLGGVIFFGAQRTDLEDWVQYGPFCTAPWSENRWLRSYGGTWEYDEDMAIEELFHALCAIRLATDPYQAFYVRCEKHNTRCSLRPQAGLEQMGVIELAFPGWLTNARIIVRFSYTRVQLVERHSFYEGWKDGGEHVFYVREIPVTKEGWLSVSLPIPGAFINGYVPKCKIKVQIDVLGDQTLWIPPRSIEEIKKKARKTDNWREIEDSNPY